MVKISILAYFAEMDSSSTEVETAAVPGWKPDVDPVPMEPMLPPPKLLMGCCCAKGRDEELAFEVEEL